MKLRTTVGKLTDAFAITAPTLDKKGLSASLYLNANAKSNSLYLYSTNMISETATRIAVKELEEAGEVLVNPSKLKDGLQGISKDVPVQISLSKDGNSLKVEAANVKFSLAASTGVREMGDRLKAIPKSTTNANAIIPASELTEFASRAEFCLPNDETGQRANLAVLKLTTGEECEEVYATDGNIAVHVSSAKKQGKGVGLSTEILIPTVALQALKTIVAKRKGEDIGIIVVKNKVFFRCADGTHLGALLPAFTYPNLKPIINQDVKFSFSVPREILKQSLTRAGFFVSSGTTSKALELEIGETLALKANGDDSLTDSIAISYIGTKPDTKEAIKLGMNINYLLSIASASRSETLTFGFVKEDKPLVITDQESEDDEQINIKYVVMGVRLSNAISK